MSPETVAVASLDDPFAQGTAYGLRDRLAEEGFEIVADQVYPPDTFNVWWGPELASQIARAGARIHCYQIGDWLDPLPDVVLGRGLPDDGFNQELWDIPGDAVVRRVVERYDRHVR